MYNKTRKNTPIGQRSVVIIRAIILARSFLCPASRRPPPSTEQKNPPRLERGIFQDSLTKIVKSDRYSSAARRRAQQIKKTLSGFFQRFPARTNYVQAAMQRLHIGNLNGA